MRREPTTKSDGNNKMYMKSSSRPNPPLPSAQPQKDPGAAEAGLQKSSRTARAEAAGIGGAASDRDQGLVPAFYYQVSEPSWSVKSSENTGGNLVPGPAANQEQQDQTPGEALYHQLQTFFLH